ncbi:MAG TPA: secondary thiamine-phosphate synthase enzyme YjbQ [Candidatus Doudnabacteria bacterium]|nr:secondary thiamine-phosphate synthase enzyme YjbQ [Candidatus Doudnabacteria bacterium]
MAIFSKIIEVTSHKQFELIDITSPVNEAVSESGCKNGLAVVYSPHTTASIRLTHNEPMLGQDIMKMLYRLVPLDDNYGHDLFEMREEVDVNERSNGHAHVKAFLLGSSETVPVADGRLQLGKKQSLFFVELDGGRMRDYQVIIYGEQ